MLVVFVGYNRHETRAAGVFRFPAPHLVSFEDRKRFIWHLLLAAALATASVFPSVVPPSITLRPVEGELRPYERDYLVQLPREEALQKAKDLVASRTVTEEDIAKLKREQRNSIPERFMIQLLAIPLGAVALTILIVWLVVGELLAGFYLALEAPGAPAQTQDSPWDVFVSRLLSSQHELEKQHLLVGFSLYGDYPVLLHKAILDQHYHLTGDTGSMKTIPRRRPPGNAIDCPR